MEERGARELLGKKPRAHGVDINSNERLYVGSGYPGSRVRGSWSIRSTTQNLAGKLIFVEGGEPEKNPRSQIEINQSQPTYEPGWNPGGSGGRPGWWPLCQPDSHQKWCVVIICTNDMDGWPSSLTSPLDNVLLCDVSRPEECLGKIGLLPSPLCTKRIFSCLARCQRSSRPARRNKRTLFLHAKSLVQGWTTHPEALDKALNTRT